MTRVLMAVGVPLGSSRALCAMQEEPKLVPIKMQGPIDSSRYEVLNSCTQSAITQDTSCIVRAWH
jgi:hypothetical protein